MLSDPLPTVPTTDSRTENAQHYLRVLHRLIDLGANLAERIALQPVNHAEATTAGIEPSGERANATSIAFERTARGVRRGILLAQRIQDPAPHPATGPAQHRTLVRQRILRVVEDEIHDKFHGDTADTLHADLLDRLDSPELGDEIDNRPADEIIADIRRDLGIAGMPGYHHPWKPRSRADVADLHARAAGRNPAPRTPPPHPARPRLALPADDGEAVAMLLRGDGRRPR